MNTIYDCYTLRNGVEIPCVAYGTYKAAADESSRVIQTAIEAGYRYFDTASFYGTEQYLGDAIQKSGVPRKEYFLASKVWKDEMGYERTKAAFAQSLKRLQTDYLDLYMIHWPLPTPGYMDWKKLDVDTWRALEELYQSKKVRAIGLSNFLPHHIENILQNCDIEPMTNQLEYHPGYAQEAAVQYCKEHNIRVQGWSPLGRGRMFGDPLFSELTEKYRISPAQLCLRFAVQNGVIPLPKSSTMERMKENQDLFSFEISEEDMYRLRTMPQAGWSGEHPDRERMYF